MFHIHFSNFLGHTTGMFKHLHPCTDPSMFSSKELLLCNYRDVSLEYPTEES